MKINELPETTRLIQLAEEAAELAQAAIKLTRALNGQTPVSEKAARDHLVEEIADVNVCVDALAIDGRKVRQTARRKAARWEARLEDRPD